MKTLSLILTDGWTATRWNDGMLVLAHGGTQYTSGCGVIKAHADGADGRVLAGEEEAAALVKIREALDQIAALDEQADREKLERQCATDDASDTAHARRWAAATSDPNGNY